MAASRALSRPARYGRAGGYGAEHRQVQRNADGTDPGRWSPLSDIERRISFKRQLLKADNWRELR
jgi:hypothetical protein